jgi:hypothetical protein
MRKLALLTAIVLVMASVTLAKNMIKPVLVGPMFLLLDTDSPKKVFLTSARYYGTLGGVTGADQKCNALAQAAWLPGKYMAWISDENSSPKTRFTKSQIGYMLVDGTMIADNWDDLTDCHLMHRIDMDESGVTISSLELVWTGTYCDGAAEGPNCTNWTSPNAQGVIGNTHLTGSQGIDQNWSYYWTRACNNLHRLFCFEQ